MQVTRFASAAAGTPTPRRLPSSLASPRRAVGPDTLGPSPATPYAPSRGFTRKPALTRTAGLVSAAGAALLIAACGGGGGGGTAVTTVDPVDKYIGPWAVCIVDPAVNASARLEFTAGKIGPTQASTSAQAIGFANTSCAPPAAIIIPIPEFTGIGTIDSPGSGPSSADKVTFTPSNTAIPSFKDITLVFNGNQLQFGDPASPLDAEGYPTALDPTITFTRQ